MALYVIFSGPVTVWELNGANDDSRVQRTFLSAHVDLAQREKQQRRFVRSLSEIP